MKHALMLIPTDKPSNVILKPDNTLTYVTPPKLGVDGSLGKILIAFSVDIELCYSNVSEGDICLYDDTIGRVSYKGNSDENSDIWFGSTENGCSTNFDMLKRVECSSDYDITPMSRIYRDDINMICDYYNQCSFLPKLANVKIKKNDVYVDLVLEKEVLDNSIVIESVNDKLLCDVTEVIKRASYRLYPNLVHTSNNSHIIDGNKESRDIWVAGALWAHNNIKKK